ncbi:MAG: hypothetical protein HN580_18590 [Deltaproteobacteria bacterium]|nr:hypothetical protein [Deltaproteobacteria bacterium]MBT4088822.1 hypothetical protein [Deltaproteobacteria bacterium]MBT4266042.1 hypothetical protein [Deltaproteobacteria bacterium]MBT4642143.1 hypothetical protein [Deltaproteobacteria bacterium]MBT6499881.1 hypothetical protein [Deltaproteobacteria bacterium]
MSADALGDIYFFAHSRGTQKTDPGDSELCKNYNGCTGRNPKTGVKVQVQPKKLPTFRAGRELRNLLYFSTNAIKCDSRVIT